MKPNKLTEWTSRLSGPIVGYWGPSDTISLRRTANNTAKRPGITADDIEVLIFNANNLPHGPLPVNGHYEDKAFRFWRDTMFTVKGVRRQTTTTRGLSDAAVLVIMAYLNWHRNHLNYDTAPELRPYHAFNGLHDNTDAKLMAYWGGTVRSVHPIWRMIAPGVGFIDYVNIPWQQMSVNEHGVERLTILQVGKL